MESLEAEQSVNRIWMKYHSTPPEEAGVKYYADRLRAGQITRAQMESEMANSPGVLLRDKPKPGDPTKEAGQEDARVVLDGVLDRYGLGSLKPWAWEQIQLGHSAARIESDLRNTPEYKTRFKGLIDRQQAGLPAWTEQQWIEYENGVSNLFRSRGLPAGMFDSPDDFIQYGVNDLLLPELEERVDQYFVKVNNAAPEIKQAFAEMFGASGPQALLALMLDANKALPILQQMVAAAENQGIGAQLGFNLKGFGGGALTGDLAGTGRAGELAQAGFGGADVRQGLAQLSERKALFAESISEKVDMAAELEGVNAIFGLGDATALERRRRSRIAALSGGGGSVLQNAGVGAGSAE
jgi:hypothetical protein